MTTVYLAQRLGETCHFGVESTARAWAGKNGAVQAIHVNTPPDLRLAPDCGPDCNDCGMLCKQGRRVDEHFAHRLSIALECMLIDPDRNRQHAEETLEDYKAAWETVNPSPPTFMGEPTEPEDYSDCHGPDWRDRETEYLK